MYITCCIPPLMRANRVVQTPAVDGLSMGDIAWWLPPSKESPVSQQHGATGPGRLFFLLDFSVWELFELIELLFGAFEGFKLLGSPIFQPWKPSRTGLSILVLPQRRSWTNHEPPTWTSLIIPELCYLWDLSHQAISACISEPTDQWRNLRGAMTERPFVQELDHTIYGKWHDQKGIHTD